MAYALLLSLYVNSESSHQIVKYDTDLVIGKYVLNLDYDQCAIKYKKLQEIDHKIHNFLKIFVLDLRATKDSTENKSGRIIKMISNVSFLMTVLI